MPSARRVSRWGDAHRIAAMRFASEGDDAAATAHQANAALATHDDRGRTSTDPGHTIQSRPHPPTPATPSDRGHANRPRHQTRPRLPTLPSKRHRGTLTSRKTARGVGRASTKSAAQTRWQHRSVVSLSWRITWPLEGCEYGKEGCPPRTEVVRRRWRLLR